MAGSLFGLGAGTPSRFPYPDRPQPSPGVSPSQGQVVRAQVVIVKGATGGVFVYDAASGALIGSISNAATDPVNHTPILPAAAVYDPVGNTYVQLLPGSAGAGPAAVRIGTGNANETAPGQLTSVITGTAGATRLAEIMRAPKMAGQAVGAACSLVLESYSQDLTLPVLASLVTSDGALNTTAYNQTPNLFSFSGGPIQSISGTPAAPTVIITDSWQNLAPAVTGYTVSICRYQMTARKTVLFQIQARANAGGGTAGTYNVTTTLPGIYQPPGTLALSLPLGYNGTLAAGANSGSLLVDEASSANAGRIRVQVPGLPVNTDIGCVVEWPLD